MAAFDKNLDAAIRARFSGSESPQVPSTSNQAHLNSQSTVAMTHDEKMIAALVQNVVPVFKSEASAIPMQTDQAGGNTANASTN
ncbi:hypothetical protein PCANC_25138 [Puccinia coronata f. sp. avenae]|uniref:Uncharacterized protein n=1 Tax=Puccinia coronata f. sp. avenae TaxID=200324 RepID=A0A2N5U0M5_9BASI|nr:hypothetical protein PCANC_25138 [Puccinia coronata f. sp. avenae]